MSWLIENLKKEASQIQIISPVGGKGSRALPIEIISALKNQLGSAIEKKLYVPKHILKVKNKPLIQWFIEYFEMNGFREFVFLLNEKNTEINEFLEKAKNEYSNLEIKTCFDPKVQNVGKGKAILHALRNGVIDKNKKSILAFPDDFIFYKFAPLELLLRHLHYRTKDKKIIATILLVPYIKLPYGVAEVEEIKVKKFKEKPNIPLYASTGMAIFEPEIYAYIEEIININSPFPMEIEEAIYPILAEEGRMAFTLLPSGEDWIAVNSLKDLAKLEERLSKGDA